MNRKKVNILPVIFGGFVNGYSLARTIFETYRIKSLVLDYNKHFSYYSKLLSYRIVSDPKVDESCFLEEVIRLGQELSSNHLIIVFATNDEWLFPLSNHRDILEKHYYFPFSDLKSIITLSDKSKLYQKCEELSINHPKTLQINDITQFQPKGLNFPVLVKPINVVDYSKCFTGANRNEIFQNEGLLIEYLKNRFTNDQFNSGFILQEYISGDVENLFTITTYSDNNCDVRGISTGYKVKQYPPQAGTIRIGFVKEEPRIIMPTKKLLAEVGFFGIANSEYKYNPKTDNFDLIEVNPRPGMWNYSSYMSGVNLIEMLFNEHVFNLPLTEKKSDKNLVWTIEGKREIPKKYFGYDIVNPTINSSEKLFYKFNLLTIKIKIQLINIIKIFRHLCRQFVFK